MRHIAQKHKFILFLNVFACIIQMKFLLYIHMICFLLVIHSTRSYFHWCIQTNTVQFSNIMIDLVTCDSLIFDSYVSKTYIIKNDVKPIIQAFHRGFACHDMWHVNHDCRKCNILAKWENLGKKQNTICTSFWWLIFTYNWNRWL